VLRRLLTALLRITELPPSFCAAFMLTGMVLGFVKEQYAPIVGSEAAAWLS